MVNSNFFAPTLPLPMPTGNRFAGVAQARKSHDARLSSSNTGLVTLVQTNCTMKNPGKNSPFGTRFQSFQGVVDQWADLHIFPEKYMPQSNTPENCCSNNPNEAIESTESIALKEFLQRRLSRPSAPAALKNRILNIIRSEDN